ALAPLETFAHRPCERLRRQTWGRSLARWSRAESIADATRPRRRGNRIERPEREGSKSNFPAANSCIWQQVLPRFQLCRVLRERSAGGAQMVCFRYFRQRGQQ